MLQPGDQKLTADRFRSVLNEELAALRKEVSAGLRVSRCWSFGRTLAMDPMGAWTPLSFADSLQMQLQLQLSMLKHSQLPAISKWRDSTVLVLQTLQLSADRVALQCCQ
jgi:hypothetical protein